MKKCPVCDKTFDDSMRFCQTDGTPLVDTVEEAPDDPFKTTVARPDEIASAIPPPVDPFKTIVAGSESKEESGDLLQLPEEYDPMKTVVGTPGDFGNEPVESAAPQEQYAPSSPFSEPDSPLELDMDKETDFSSSAPPEPPQFSEPSLNPPDFSDMSSSTDASENATEIISSSEPFSYDAGSTESTGQKDAWSDSPFNKPSDAIPSPFGDTPSSYDKPSTPPYKEPEPPTVLGGSSPFDQPFSPPQEPQQDPFGQQQDPFNQPLNAPMQQSEWTPPPAPASNWQEQGIGANTPFQPPPAGQGLNQTLPIVSLVFGILSVCCYVSPITGLVALVTGYLGIKNVNQDPNQYGGKGLAIAGMIVGGLFFLLGVIYWVLIFIGVAMGNFGRF